MFFSYFPGGTYFRTYFVSYFGPKAQNLFSSRPSGSQFYENHEMKFLKMPPDQSNPLSALRYHWPRQHMFNMIRIAVFLTVGACDRILWPNPSTLAKEIPPRQKSLADAILDYLFHATTHSDDCLRASINYWCVELSFTGEPVDILGAWSTLHDIFECYQVCLLHVVCSHVVPYALMLSSHHLH